MTRKLFPGTRGNVNSKGDTAVKKTSSRKCATSSLSDLALFQMARQSDLCAVVLLARWGFHGPAIPAPVPEKRWFNRTGKDLVEIIRSSPYQTQAKEKLHDRATHHPH